jgi:hypothetical protein
MRDIAAVEFGARMSQASSHHSQFLPKNILDRFAPQGSISQNYMSPENFTDKFSSSNLEQILPKTTPICVL